MKNNKLWKKILPVGLIILILVIVFVLMPDCSGLRRGISMSATIDGNNRDNIISIYQSDENIEVFPHDSAELISSQSHIEDIDYVFDFTLTKPYLIIHEAIEHPSFNVAFVPNDICSLVTNRATRGWKVYHCVEGE